MPDSTNRPPLAKAVREFMTGIQWPPLPKKCRHNHLKDHSHLVLAMLLHARSVQEKAESITCSPSLLQIAQLMFCSTRTVRRAIDAFPRGFLSVKNRGKLSNEFTIYRKYQPHLDRAQSGHSPNRTQGGHLKSDSKVDTKLSQVDTNPVLSGHQTVLSGHRVSTSGVDLQELRSSGVNLQGKSAKAKPTALPLEPESQSQPPEPTMEERRAQALERLIAHMKATGQESEIPEVELRLARSQRVIEKQREEARSIADRVLPIRQRGKPEEHVSGSVQ